MSKDFFYPLLENPYRNEDVIAGIKVLKSKRITLGKITKKFENNFEKKIKVKNALMVNSGSSANLLALQCLINPYRKKKLKKNDEILIPSICWSTSLWPIVQSGLKPVFVDIDKSTLNINLDDLRKKINRKTKAILIVHVLGNCTNMDELLRIKKKNNLILIEDTCESLGTKYKNRCLGTFGEFSTFSFYSSHQISSGEGGMICCKSSEDNEIIKSLRSHGWSRGLKNEKKISSQNRHLDKRFIFYNSGFNLRPTEIAASIGMNQFKDLELFIRNRKKNRLKIVKSINKNAELRRNLNILTENKNVKASWFGLPVILNKKLNRKRFITNVEKGGIETRPILCGNFIKQPSIKKYKLIKRNKFPNADHVNKHGFFIGLPTNKISSKKISRLVKILVKSL